MSCNHAYVNFKFQPIKDGAVITISQVFCLESKDIMNPK